MSKIDEIAGEDCGQWFPEHQKFWKFVRFETYPNMFESKTRRKNCIEWRKWKSVKNKEQRCQWSSKDNAIADGGAPRGKRDGGIWHICRAWKGESDEKITLLRKWSVWHQTWLGKLGVKMNFRHFVGVICAKNLRESGITSPFLGPHWGMCLIITLGFILDPRSQRSGSYKIGAVIVNV